MDVTLQAASYPTKASLPKCNAAREGHAGYVLADKTLYVCSKGSWTAVPMGTGAPGASSRILITPEPAGANCASGGQKIEVGIDTNNNGILDPAEVQQTAYVCNGAPAEPPGPDGGAVVDSGVPDAPDAQTASCDPVQQDCPNPIQACVLTPWTGATSCAGVPLEAEHRFQGSPCYGNVGGNCYINGCAKGYGPNLPDEKCAFFCNPTENWAGSINGLTGDPTGITCGSFFAGARPDGPGPSYECRYVQSFWSNADPTAVTIGMCVNPAEHGSCADFDWNRAQADIASGANLQPGYCETICPECCMKGCISLATYNAALPQN